MRRFSKRVVIAGGSGGIGGALIAHFAQIGLSSVVLSRGSRYVEGAHRTIEWMGDNREWTEELEGALAVVNLCGESLAQRWTEPAKKRIIESRVEPTRLLGDAIANASDPPRVWINASAIGIYGDTGQHVRDEESPPGSGFLPESCKAWESAVHQAPPSPTVRAILRLGVVLSPQFGYLSTLSSLTQKGLGGRIGKGEQWISWIHIEDLCRAFGHLIEHEQEGVANAVAPVPVQQKEFSARLVKALQAPLAPPAPEWAVRIGTSAIGLDPSLVLMSSRIAPNALLGDGFQFKFETLEAALGDLL